MEHGLNRTFTQQDIHVYEIYGEYVWFQPEPQKEVVIAVEEVASMVFDFSPSGGRDGGVCTLTTKQKETWVLPVRSGLHRLRDYFLIHKKKDD